MIIECPVCHKKNRAPNGISTKAKFRCGSCGRTIGIENDKAEPEYKNNKENIDSDHNSNKAIVFQKIELWKKHLLDLTRRNRLLHFKTSRTSTIEFTSPTIKEIFNRLVIKGHSLSFPLPKRERQHILAELFPSDSKEASQDDYKPGDIETDTPVLDLQRKLYRLRREWKTWQEEQGVHTLFLSVGMLHWFESEAEQEESIAPLILIPVLLEKLGLEKPYKIHFADEDITINPALSYKLNLDFGIQIPELSEEPDWNEINELLSTVTQLIPDDWEVMDEMWLARFSFDKFVMYRDLDEQKEKALTHPIIRALANICEIPIEFELKATEDMDNLVNPEELFPVLDADSSQLEVLIRARGGQNLIVAGPPGTGKSQTIANLIAQSLRDHKKVLFVSEKMAALEVVFKRLKEIGLSFACLEVHSHRSNKSRVIQELGKTLQERLDIIMPSDAHEQFRRMIRRQDMLNQFVKELHKKRSTLNISAYQAYGKLTKLSNAPSLNFNLPLLQAQEVSSDDLDTWLSAIRGLADISEVWDNFTRHPWAGDDLDLTSFTIDQRDMLLDIIKKLQASIHKLDNISNSISEMLGIPKPTNLKDVESLIEVLKVLSEIKPISESWLQRDAANLYKYSEYALEAEKHSFFIAEAKKRFNVIFKESLFTLPVEEFLSRFTIKYRTILRWFKKTYWEDVRILKSHSKSNRKLGYRSISKGLLISKKILSEMNWFKANEIRLTESFGRLYKGASSNWDDIKSGLNWTDRLISILPVRYAPDKIVNLSFHPQNLRDKIKRPQEDLIDLMISSSNHIKELKKIYKSLFIQTYEIQETPFVIFKDWLNSRNDPKDLDNWVFFLRSKADCIKLGLEEFVEVALKAQVPSFQLVGTFLKRFWRLWISEAHKDSPQLNEFRGQRHEEIIREFRTLDSELKQVTIRLIQNEVQNTQPKRSEAKVDSSQVGILLRETQKRRRHRPLRKLFFEIPHLLQDLKPCLLMSPLSVAAYLGNSNCQFDLVIFDEASQITPENAIGSIIRGKKLIVAGDNKQLPPTRFFQAYIDIEDEEEAGEEMLLESILDECVALPSGFIQTPLLWHYRSRHEELIAFSNRQFYDNSLITFPSPFPKGSTGAVRFIYVPDGIYDYGGSRTNRIEAKKIIDLVSEHLRSGIGGSLGIITLSLAQEEAVLQEWERRKAAAQDLINLVEEEGDEPFFIKTLEKVQGDERDYIYMSIGHGPDQNRVVHMQFGPINREGGERRLNVAVTRARYRTTIVSSLRPQDLDLTKLTTGYRGVANLQKYLEYAQNGGAFSEESKSTGIPESDFEISVKEAIESKGFQVDPQVGFSGFRIDLGVRHPDYLNRYILGIECDGATYHSHRTARERDRLRQEVLMALGWKIYRIWSTDWIRNPEQVLNQVVQRITNLRKKEDPGISSQASKPKENPQVQDIPPVDTEDYPGSIFPQKENANLSQLPTYKYFVPTEKKPSHWFYEAQCSDFYWEKLNVDVLTVVRLEGPIHFQALCNRIRDVYGLQKTGAKIQEIVQSILDYFENKKYFVRDGDFIMIVGCKVGPRIPGPGENPRPVEWIAVEELAATVKWLLKTEIGMSRDILIRETARIMGYKRTGSDVQERINKSIELLLKEGKIGESDNQIVLIK